MANKRKVIIYRFQTNPDVNPRAAEALVEFYQHGEATAQDTPFGIVSNLLTHATAEQIFRKLSTANIGNHFTVIELDQEDRPIKTITSNGSVVTIDGPMPSSPEEDLAGMSSDELKEELDRLLVKVGRHGQLSLTPVEKARLDYISQLNLD